MACEGGILHDTIPATTLSVTFSLARSETPLGEAFDKADNLSVGVRVEGQEPVERVFQLAEGAEEIRARLEVALPSEQALAAVAVELRRGSDGLFVGEESVLLRMGETHQVTLALAPVPAQLLVPSSIVIDVLGQPVQLEGTAGFATGDPIPDLPVTWSTHVSGIQLTPDGILVAERNGIFEVTAASGTLVATVQVEVAAEPTSVAFVSEHEESAFPGEPLPGSPVVRVTHGEIPMPGVEVSFTADMAGEVSEPAPVTDEDGLATLGAWILGDHGENTLTARAEGAPIATLTVATRDPCTRAFPLELGETVEGRLVPRRSCTPPSGRLTERWRIAIPAGTLFHGIVTSDDFAPAIFGLHDPDAVQFHGRGIGAPGSLRHEYVLPAATYLLSVGTNSIDAEDPPAGAYSLSTETVGEPQVGCMPASGVTFGSVAEGRIAEGDCVDQSAADAAEVTRRFDGYVTLLHAGQTLSVTLVADVPYWFTRWTSPGGGVEAQFVEGFFAVPAGEPRTLTVTPSVAEFQLFFVLPDDHEGAGNYTMTFSAASGVAAERAGTGAPDLVPGLLRRDRP